MEPSIGTPSLMYFIPQVEGKSANLVYLNGIDENSGIQHSVGSVPSTISIKQAQSDSHTALCGAANVTYAVLRSNRCHNDLVAAHGNAFQIRTVTAGGQTTTGKNDTAQHKQIRKCGSDEEEPNLGRASKCAFRAVSEETEKEKEEEEEEEEEEGNDDELAFRITEFFKSADDVEVCLQYNRLPEPGKFPEQRSWETTQHTLIDGPSGSYRLGSFKYEEFIEGGISEHANNGGQSAKWNGFESGTVSESIPFSGQLFYSGYLCPASHSGNVSHRSDSSTTSTHSFAFPILPCEWNSSPVKMAVPEERYVKAPWKKRVCRFFCCKSAANLQD